MWPSLGDVSRQRPIQITVRDLDAERGPPLPLSDYQNVPGSTQQTAPSVSHTNEKSSSASSSSSSSSSSTTTSTAATTAAGDTHRNTAATTTVPATPAAAAATPLSMGWLLRLFRSDFFDAWMAVTYLYRYRASRGVHDYLCNELYHLSDPDLEAFLPQLCNLLVHHAKDSPALERFVMDKCASSLHFALQVYWFLQAAVEDAVRDANKDAEARCRLLRTRCETAAVNGVRNIQQQQVPFVEPATTVTAQPATTPASSRSVPLSSTPEQTARAMPSVPAVVTSTHIRTPQPTNLEFALSSPDSQIAPTDSSVSLDDVAKAGAAMRIASPTDTACATAQFRTIANATSQASAPLAHSRLDVEDDERPVTEPSIASDIATIGDSDDLPRGEIDESDSEPTQSHESHDEVLLGKHVAPNPKSLVTKEAVHASDNGTNSTPSKSGMSHADRVSPATCLDGQEAPAFTVVPPDHHAVSNIVPIDKSAAFDPTSLLTMKQERFDYFNDSLTIVKAFVRLSLSLREVPNDDRLSKLKSGLREVNEILLRRMAGEPTSSFSPVVPSVSQGDVSYRGSSAALRSVHLPLSRALSPALRVLRVIAEDAIILTSRTRVPYMLFVEVLPTDMVCSDQYLFCHHVIAELQERGLPAPPHLQVQFESENTSSNQALTRSNVGTDHGTPTSGFGSGSELNEIRPKGKVSSEEVSSQAGFGATSSELPSDTNREHPAPKDLVSRDEGRAEAGMSRSETQKKVATPEYSIQRTEQVSFPSRSSPTDALPIIRSVSEGRLLTSSGMNRDTGIPSRGHSRSQDVSINTTAARTSSTRISEKTPAERQRANVCKAVYGQLQHVSAFMDLDVMDEELASSSSVYSSESSRTLSSDEEIKSREAALLAVYGELWSWKEERILSSSPFRDLRNIKLMPLIVKAGDDLRQEQLAIQLMTQFKWIFAEEAVDVYLRPFTVMSVSSDAGFVEVIPDAVSIHSLKKRTPNFVSLLDYFERAYGKIGSRSFREAQRRFIRSMAGYSLVTYFLQIKDRHNGNIMLNAEGNIIHIDFGFMLTNSPGAIKFENVPFKLTEEYLQVICARKSVQDASETSRNEGYRYFQELFVLGLLAARKHYEKLTTLVEIMMEGTSMPCMSGGHSVIESLRHRFCLGVSEEQCITHALGLIEESRLSWRSASYDKFQQMQNGYC